MIDIRIVESTKGVFAAAALLCPSLHGLQIEHLCDSVTIQSGIWSFWNAIFAKTDLSAKLRGDDVANKLLALVLTAVNRVVVGDGHVLLEGRQLTLSLRTFMESSYKYGQILASMTLYTMTLRTEARR